MVSPLFRQGLGGVAGASEEGNKLGESLASGNFNNDGRDDFAIGVPYQNIDGVAFAGAVNVIFGSAAGLQPQ